MTHLHKCCHLGYEMFNHQNLKIGKCLIFSYWRRISKLCQSLDVYLLFAIWMGQIQSKLIYIFLSYELASLRFKNLKHKRLMITHPVELVSIAPVTNSGRKITKT